MDKKQYRAYKFSVKSLSEIKEVDGIKVATATGYLSVFGNVDAYGDVVRMGAFTKTISENDHFTLLADHTPSIPIGKFTAKEDSYGLLINMEINMEVEAARDKYFLLKQKAIKGLSIGFQTMKEEFEGDIRYLTEIKLWEGSVVTFPANDLSLVTDVRSMSDATAMMKFKLTQVTEAMKDLEAGVGVKCGGEGKESVDIVKTIDEVVTGLMSLRDIAADTTEEEPGK